MEFNEELKGNLTENEYFKEKHDLNIFLKYVVARIDFKNYGTSSNDLIILENSEVDYEVISPSWYSDFRGKGKIMHSDKGHIDLKVKCVKKGVFKLFLKGIDSRNKGNKRIPVPIDYTKLIINDICIFDSAVTVWHDWAYEYDKHIEDNEIITIHIEWKPYESNLYSF